MGDALAAWPQTRGHDLLRAYSDAVNLALLERWLPVGPLGAVLKTDAFDEAVGRGLFPLLEARAREVVAVDVSPSTLAAARERHPQLNASQGDVRQLQFGDATFDAVVSNSTLDHLRSRSELRAAVRELARVLLPGGTLILTLDNPLNPLVRFRSMLPYPLLRRLGVVQYPMGATFGPSGLRRLVSDAGLDVTASASLMHVPRVLALGAAVVVPRNLLLQGLLAAESLAHLPTRHVTGQFVGVRAVKR